MRAPLFAAAAALAAAALPAFAQTTTVEQLTVMGRFAPRGAQPQSISRVVDYSDLDLRLAADQDVLRGRVIRVARDICRQLGEPSGPPNLGHSCEDVAVRDAMTQVGQAVAYAMATPPPAYAVIAPAPPVAEPAPVTSEPIPDAAPAAGEYGQGASATVPDTPSYTSQTVTNGPVPDTPSNRARYGQPMSRAGQQTTPRGN
jgi:UrcA family protein